jgi:hypothetical protein
MTHEVTEVRQGRLIVSLEHTSGLWWPGGTKAALQGGIEIDLRPRRPSDDIHVRPSIGYDRRLAPPEHWAWHAPSVGGTYSVPHKAGLQVLCQSSTGGRA